ncbi:hypothetical protein CH373_03755 [Leptospira perolatii]|uniref:Uncharacterized protein n=1 Tax=Leptospira perolatii TaxID=2023191 RepID=A0A2M9ZTD5_9LEPT|nr:hypothetical protein CH360_14635 [Leptospira perolatii]PJZ75241.1 hypothetical protein CH373_03755 [Leptospira perolatii]
MGFFFRIFLTIGIYFFITRGVSAVSYEEAYAMEKDSPVFAIPLYEEVVRTAKQNDVRKTASTRLYFLYEKFRKYVPALQYQIRAGTTKTKKGEWSSIVQSVSQGLGVSPYSLIGVLSSCSRSTPPLVEPQEQSVDSETGKPVPFVPFEPYRSLLKPENAPLVRLCYSIKMKLKDYESWENIFQTIVQKNSISKETALPLWVGYSLQSGRGVPYRRIYLSGTSKVLTNESKSDIAFLYAKFLRHKGRWEASTRYFLMSGTYGNPRRAKFEAAKNLLLMDRKQEACDYPQEIYNGSEEPEALFRKICQTKGTDWGAQYSHALRILSKDSPDPLYSYILQGGGKEARDYFVKEMGTFLSDTDTDGEEDLEPEEILTLLLPNEDRNKLPFWDARDREANLVLPDRTKYICKVLRRPFFSNPSIQPQYCTEIFPGTLEQMLNSVEEEEEVSFAFADPAYLPISAKLFWKEVEIIPENPVDPPVQPTLPVKSNQVGPTVALGPWNLEYFVYRKILNRTYAEIRLGKEYFVVAVKPSIVAWQK